MADEGPFRSGRVNATETRLDASTSMSAVFQLNIKTEQAARQFKTVEEAIARIKSANAPTLRGAQSRRSSSPVRGRSGAKKPDSSSMVVMVGNAYSRVETKAEAALAEAMKMGHELAVLEVVTAYTPYGRERFARGRGKGAGRYDSGDMVEGLDWNVTRTTSQRSGGSRYVTRKRSTEGRGQSRTVNAFVRNTTMIGYFGWDKPRVYQIAQEKGFRHWRAGTAKKPRKVVNTRPGRIQVAKAPTGYVPGALALGRSMGAARGRLQYTLRKV